MATEAQDVDLDIEVEEYVERGQNLLQRVTGTMRTTLMVGIGMADVAQEKAHKMWDSTGDRLHEFAERGERVSEKRRDQLGEVVEKRQTQIKDLGERAEHSFDKYSEAVLTRANIPTAEDIEDLSKQVNSLSRKVDKVRKEQQETAS